MSEASSEPRVYLRRPHQKQRAFIDSPAKRKVIRAGRRGGKTTGVATMSVTAFLAGRRVLYAAPTEDQISAYWFEVKKALSEPVEAGIFSKNETIHSIELPGTKQRIRAKTAFNADTLRGDYADLLILDEFQMHAEETWELVGAPMLVDNDGDAVFVYTPPSLVTRAASKAKDPRYAAKMYKKAEADASGRWQAFHFSSRENPHVSERAIDELGEDMSPLAIRQEIEAEDIDEVPGAMWTNVLVEKHRVSDAPPMKRIAVGVDPSGGGDEIGIVAGGRGYDDHGYTLADRSQPGYLGPNNWAQATVDLYYELEADCIVAERNFGGDMVEHTIRTVDPSVPVKMVSASRGKAVRAEPVAALASRGREHHAGEFPAMEAEMTSWTPDDRRSPNRMDAKVWTLTELMLNQSPKPRIRTLQMS